MARQVLPIVGAVVGGYFGGPQGAQIGFAIGSFVGNAVDPQRLSGPRIGEIPLQTSEEGAVCPLIAGTAPAIGNLIYKHLFDPVIVEEQQGKGGGPIIESERLYGTFAIRICASLFDGPGTRNGVTGIRRIWEDEKLVYDVSEDSVILEESAAYAEGFTFYPGDETQLPDPDLEAIEGVGNVPAYRGRAYIVFNYKDLTDRRGSVPQFRFEITLEAEQLQNIALMTDVRTYGGSRTALEVASANVGWNAGYDLVAINPSGDYAVCGPYDTDAVGFEFRKYDSDNETWNVLTAPTVNDGKLLCMAWDPSGTYLAVGRFYNDARKLTIYKRTGDALADIDSPEGLGAATIAHVAWDSSGQRLFGARGNTGEQFFLSDFFALTDTFSEAVLFGQSGDGSGKFVAPMRGVGSRYMIGVAGGGISTDSYVTAWDVSGVPDRRTAAVVFEGIAAHFDESLGYVVTVSTNGPDYLALYDFDYSVIGTESLTPTGYPITQPPNEPIGRSTGSAASPDNAFLAVATGLDQQPFIYDLRTPSVVTKLTNPAATGALVSAVSWTATPELPQLEAGTATLPSVVSAIVGRVKQPASLVNTAQVSSEIVRGISLGSQDYTATDALRSLAQTYLFDAADYDEQIHLVPRGGAVAFSVTEDDLVEAPGDSFIRANAIEQPGKISLFFQNPTIYYQPSKANPPFIGYENGSVNEVSVQVPVVLRDSDEAPQLVDKMQKISDADAQGEISRIVPDRYLSVVPGTVGALTERGITRRVRVTGVEEYDYKMRLKMRIDRQSAVTSNLTATPTPAPDPPPLSLSGVTQFAVLNIPAIVDSDDTMGVGIRVAVCGLPGTAWAGCRVDYSSDGGANWNFLANITRAARMGNLLEPITAASPHYTDRTNALSLLLIGDEDLESLTQAQFLSEGNGAALCNADGTAELIQFRDVVDEGDQEWTATRLLRGRLATDAAAHAASTQFVMLDGTTFLPLPTSLMGANIRLRFTSLGTSPELAPTFDFVWNPVHSQREFQPAHLFLERDGDNILASTVPRHRFGTENNPIASANWTGYRWTATDGSNTATQDTATTAPTATFDCTGWATPITVTVAMTNRFTGAGPSLSEDIA